MIKYCIFSECGNRRRNEDAIGIRIEHDCTGLFVVCDGMGGLQKGDEASHCVVEAFLKCWDERKAKESISQMIERATHLAKECVDHIDCRETGSTLVLSVVNGNTLTLAHLGDSRGYLYRKGKGTVYQTEDHITIGEEGWPYVSKGFFSFRDVEMPGMKVFKLEDGDRILLCSDGVSSFIKEDELVKTCMAVADIEEATAMLKSLCASRSYDNYSAIVIDYSHL